MQLTEHEKALYALAREYIAKGSLPRTVPGRFWAGPGTRATCDLCGLSIEPEQVEYEFTADNGVTLHFHMRCHAIWQLAATDNTTGI